MRKPVTFLCLSTIALTIVAASRVQAQGPFLEVSKSEAGFTVEAENATLPQVLAKIGEEAGFAVQDSSAAGQREPIPVFEVRDATLESTLRQLLGTANHLIVYRGGGSGKIEDGSVDKIVLLSPGKRERMADRPVSSLAGPPGTQAAKPVARTRRPVTAARGQSDPEFVQQQQEQLQHGEALEEMERQMVEQMGVDPTAVAGGDPGVPPAGLPPNVREQLEAYAAGGGRNLPPEAQRRLEELTRGNGAMPPPDLVGPTD